MSPLPESREESGRPELQRFHEAVYIFTAAERRLIARYKRAGDSLSPGRVRALNVLLREDEASAGTLAREAGLKPNSITPMIEQLERSGMITRRRDETDRRMWWISLTDRGRSELAELGDEWNARFAEAFADTSDRELAIASRVLERLAEVFTAFIPN
jgi:DNA-binding MarR family transcriptional regulator